MLLEGCFIVTWFLRFLFLAKKKKSETGNNLNMAFRDIPLHNSSNDNSGNREFLNSHSTPANSPAKDASMAPKCVISWPSLNATHFTKLHQTNHWSPLVS
jgi:hypothetical protein